MSATGTVYLWWLWPYLLVGAITYPWFSWRAYQSVPDWERSGMSFWQVLSGGGTTAKSERRWWVRVAVFALVVVAWPVALWEEFR